MNSLRNFLRTVGGAVGLTGMFSIWSILTRTYITSDPSPNTLYKTIYAASPLLLHHTDTSPVSGAILNNVLKGHLAGNLPQSSITQLTSSAYALSSLNLTPPQHDLVLKAYMSGMHSIFIMYAPIIGVCFIAASIVKDRGVAERDASAAERKETTGTGDQAEIQDERGSGKSMAEKA